MTNENDFHLRKTFFLSISFVIIIFYRCVMQMDTHSYQYSLMRISAAGEEEEDKSINAQDFVYSVSIPKVSITCIWQNWSNRP